MLSAQSIATPMESPPCIGRGQPICKLPYGPASYSVIHSSGSTYHITPRQPIKKGGITLENLTEMLKGVLEGCVLEIISRGETYGYEIASSLRTLGFVDVVEGTVYTILLRLEKSKLVNIEKRSSTMGPPRKFYSLNEAGHAELATFWAKWNFVSLKIDELKEKADG